MRRFIISELSMSPALLPGDRFLARRLRNPRRGQVVFFPHPRRQDFWLVKRVVGLPGESLTIEGGSVRIDGEPVDEPWALDATHPEGRWEIPSRHMFVLSDARRRTTTDSRTLGPVPIRPSYRVGLRYRRSGR